MRQATRAPEDRPHSDESQPAQRVVAKLGDDRQPGGVELARRRRRAPAGHPVGLLDEGHAEADRASRGRRRDEIRGTHTAARAAPEYERAQRPVDRVQVGASGSVGGVELEHAPKDETVDERPGSTARQARGRRARGAGQSPESAAAESARLRGR